MEPTAWTNLRRACILCGVVFRVRHIVYHKLTPGVTTALTMPSLRRARHRPILAQPFARTQISLAHWLRDAMARAPAHEAQRRGETKAVADGDDDRTEAARAYRRFTRAQQRPPHAPRQADELRLFLTTRLERRLFRGRVNAGLGFETQWRIRARRVQLELLRAPSLCPCSGRRRGAASCPRRRLGCP